MRLSRISARWILLLTALLLSQMPSLHAQATRAGRASAFTEIKWDDYTFKFLPGNQMAQVLDANGQVIGTILSQNGSLQILPTLTGEPPN
jgi:hypothetical protein